MKTTTTQLLKDLFEGSPLKHYKKGQIMILQGESTNDFYYLYEGKMKVYDINYRGDEVVINHYKNPAFFPFSLILNSSVTSYTYEACTDIHIKKVPKEKLLELLHANPDAVLDLLSHAYLVLDKVVERLLITTSNSAKTRLVYTLINECKRFGILMSKGGYSLSISEKELGSNAGLTRETVNRETRTLKIAKLIEVRHSEIVIPDLQRLENYLRIHI